MEKREHLLTQSFGTSDCQGPSLPQQLEGRFPWVVLFFRHVYAIPWQSLIYWGFPVAQQLEQGGGFAQSLEVQGGVPPLAVRMIAAGEGAGSLPEVLNDVADFYDSEVDAKLSVITSTVEPALMILMGLLIGFIVLALYLPLFQLAGTIG